MENHTIIEMINVNKSFIKNKVKIFDNLNIQMPKNKIVGLVGNNGSGKTTFIKLISGMISADNGIILINNKDITKTKINISVLCDSNRSLYWNLTGYENIEYFSAIKGLKKDTALINRINELIDLFQINDFVYKKVESYSKGMKQRLMLLISIINYPDLLILDEPLNGLDFENSLCLKEILKESVLKDTSIILTSHDRYFIDEICHIKFKISNYTINLVEENLVNEKKLGVYVKLINNNINKFDFSNYKIIDEKRGIYFISEKINNKLFYNEIHHLLGKNQIEILSIVS